MTDDLRLNSDSQRNAEKFNAAADIDALGVELDERLNEIAALKRSILELQEIYKAERDELKKQVDQYRMGQTCISNDWASLKVEYDSLLAVEAALRLRCNQAEVALELIFLIFHDGIDKYIGRWKKDGEQSVQPDQWPEGLIILKEKYDAFLNKIKERK